MKKILRRWMIGIGVLFFAASAFVLPAVLIREPDLMSRAQRVRGTEHEGYAVEQYVWQADGTLTLVRMGNAHCFEVWRVDPKTGAKTIRRPLDRTLSHKLFSSFWFLSPDGTHLLTNDDLMRQGANFTTAISLTDGKRQNWPPVPNNVEMLRAWLPDGTEWVEGLAQGNSMRFVTHALDGSPPRNVGTLSWNMQYYASTMTSPSGILLVDTSLPASATTHRIDFAVLKPSETGLSIKKLSLALPGGADRLERAALSPDGSRIACEFHMHIEPNPLQKLMRSLFGAKSEPSQNGESLWILRCDGSERHQVGVLPDNGPRGLDSLAWTPDGKNISFGAEGGLYTVPAD